MRIKKLGTDDYNINLCPKELSDTLLVSTAIISVFNSNPIPAIVRIRIPELKRIHWTKEHTTKFHALSHSLPQNKAVAELLSNLIVHIVTLDREIMLVKDYEG